MQVTKDDWVRIGLQVLSTSGIEALKVEVLAKELQISKGSFYHYWSNRAEFLDALFVRWEERGTREVINDLEKKIISPQERLRRLFEISFSADKSLEAAIHHWANIDSDVAQRVARVEEMRLAYITKLLCDMGKPFTQARETARICYFTYLGWIDWSQRREDVVSDFAEIQQVLFRFLFI